MNIWNLLLWSFTFYAVEGGSTASDRGDDFDKDLDKDDTSDEDKDDTSDEELDQTVDEDKDEDKDEVKGHMIPKSRLDFKNEKLKQSNTKIEELQQQLNDYQKGDDTNKEPELDLNQKLGQLNAAVAKAVDEGDGEAVAKLQAHSQKLMMDHMAEIASTTSQTAAYQSTEQLQLDEMIGALEAQHGVLDQSSKQFDSEISEEVVDMYDTYIRSGKFNRPDAMAKAVKSVLGSDIRVNEEGALTTDIDKNIKAAGKNPPYTGDTGLDSDRAGITDDLSGSKLSDSEFDALPESTTARMRGDFL